MPLAREFSTLEFLKNLQTELRADDDCWNRFVTHHGGINRILELLSTEFVDMIAGIYGTFVRRLPVTFGHEWTPGDGMFLDCQQILVLF